MKVYVVHFGTGYRRILDNWISHYRRSGCPFPFAVLTDLESPAPADVEALRVSTEPFRDLIRHGQPLDYKGALILAGLEEFEDDALVVDADAFFARDPSAELGHLRSSDFAMAVDSYAERLIEYEDFQIPERCAGVMFFGWWPTRRNQVIAGYREAWTKIGEEEGFLSTLREERAFSVVAWHLRGPVLPVELNWPAKSGRNPGAFIVHHHGKK